MTGTQRIPCSDGALPASDVQETAAAKALLRSTLSSLRRALDPARKVGWDALIGARVVAWYKAQAPGSIDLLGVYWPLRGEPDLSLAYAELAAAGVQLSLPVVVARDAPLAFALWEPGEAMHRDSMGVAVPGVLRPAPRPMALLVPCLGYNAERIRLGYGGGYYDRTLEAQPRPLSVGIAYSCTLASFASAPHDVALDVMITEA